jgi:uncharacterized ion transporter superfamily protein YfcC
MVDWLYFDDLPSFFFIIFILIGIRYLIKYYEKNVKKTNNKHLRSSDKSVMKKESKNNKKSKDNEKNEKSKESENNKDRDYIILQLDENIYNRTILAIKQLRDKLDNID